jgi:hypothetical protein
MTHTRPTYSAALVRAGDLADFDVIRHDGTWRQVMDVWHDEDEEVAADVYAFEPETVEHIRAHLGGGLGQFVLVRIVQEEPQAELTTQLVTLRRVDLVTIQVEHGEAASPSPAAPAGERAGGRVTHPHQEVDGVQLVITETAWRATVRRSFEVRRASDGALLSEQGGFAEMPTTQQLRTLVRSAPPQEEPHRA